MTKKPNLSAAFEHEWFRIDKANGRIELTATMNILHHAKDRYSDPEAVIRSGRFQTPYAIYTTRAMLQPGEVPTVREEQR